MQDYQIIQLFQKALDELLKNDMWLLKHNLSEQSITHKLAEYLQMQFAENNVDCEYNGNIERDGGKKRIDILKRDLLERGLLKKGEAGDLEKEITNRAVFPDIIVHKRGINTENILIVEVKKSTSKVPFDYDFIKLKAYTSNYYGNDLNYQLGVFIELLTNEESQGIGLIRFFKNGEVVEFN